MAELLRMLLRRHVVITVVGMPRVARIMRALVKG